jgi:hypothetical protein
MKNTFVAISSAGPNRDSSKGTHEPPFWDEHAEFIDKLVDEFWLKIFPITLGTGKKLFVEGTTPAAFKLTDSKISPQGVIVANYERPGEVQI